MDFDCIRLFWHIVKPINLLPWVSEGILTDNMPRPGQPEAKPACICRCDAAERQWESERQPAALCDLKTICTNLDLSHITRWAVHRERLWLNIQLRVCVSGLKWDMKSMLRYTKMHAVPSVTFELRGKTSSAFCWIVLILRICCL